MSDMALAQERLRRCRSRYDRDTGACQTLTAELGRVGRELEEREARLALVREARLLIAKTADAQVEGVTKYLEGVVTSALQHVFGPRFKFHVQWDRNGKGGAVEFLVESPYRNSTITDDPREARGGGVQNVVDFALWVAILCMANNQGPVCVDEGFSWVSQDNLPAIWEVIAQLSEQFGWQFVMVASHVHLDAEFPEDAKVFNVRKESGISVVGG